MKATSDLPVLSVWQDDKFSPGQVLTLLKAVFPSVPDFTCESWCYEGPAEFLSSRSPDGGRIELRHRCIEKPDVLIVTTVTPEEAVVDFSARAEIDRERNPTSELPADLMVPNLCWQLRRAPLFASAPEPYPEFIKRCFIFTEKGRVFLHQTVRRPIPCRPPTDRCNTPPWVQMYAPAGLVVQPVAPTNWSDYSTDRYVVPVIGTVSRDGKYLTALASESATTMCQAWHDCMHNNPPWLPSGAPPADRRWRVRIYAMENDPDELLARVRQDFAQRC